MTETDNLHTDLNSIASLMDITVSSHFECPVMYALSIVNPKWSVPILYELLIHEEPVRFNTLERALAPITQKELSKRLRELQNSGVISRKIYAEVPPHVEYALTESGRAMISLLNGLTVWSINYGYVEDETSEENSHLESDL